MKKHKGRPARPGNPMAWKVAVMGQSKLSKADQKDFAAPCILAIDNVRKASASKADWQAIFDVANMLDTFSTMPKVMQGATDYVRTMQVVIERILNRQKETGAKALYAGELKDLADMCDLWVDVLSCVTMAEYLQCQEKTHERIVRALRKESGAIVVEAQ